MMIDAAAIVILRRARVSQAVARHRLANQPAAISLLASIICGGLVLVILVAGLAVINATGVYAQLVAAHVGERGAAQSAVEAESATLAARIELATHTVADLDRRLGQIDTAIETAATRGKTNIALAAMEAQRRGRAALADERKREAGTLAALRAERASLSAKGKQIETEAAPIRYVAESGGHRPARGW